MRYKRLLISDTAIEAIQLNIKNLEQDMYRHDIGRDNQPDSVLLLKKLDGLKAVMRQWDNI